MKRRYTVSEGRITGEEELTKACRTILPESPPALHRRGVMFLDLEHGGYINVFECVEYPQLGISIEAKTRKTKPTAVYSVRTDDGVQTFDTLAKAWTALRTTLGEGAAPPDAGR